MANETRCDRLHIADLQAEVGAWSDYNFGDVGDRDDGIAAGPLGLVEEVGELCRAFVKRTEGIRGTRAEWDDEIRKEAADIVIKLAQICHDERFSLEAAVVARWIVVQQRDWVADRQGHGIPQED